MHHVPGYMLLVALHVVSMSAMMWHAHLSGFRVELDQLVIAVRVSPFISAHLKVQCPQLHSATELVQTLPHPAESFVFGYRVELNFQ